MERTSELNGNPRVIDTYAFSPVETIIDLLGISSGAIIEIEVKHARQMLIECHFPQKVIPNATLTRMIN